MMKGKSGKETKKKREKGKAKKKVLDCLRETLFARNKNRKRLRK